MIAFTIPGDPVGKGRPRFSAASGRTYTPEKTVKYEQWVRLCCSEHCKDFFPAGTPVKAEIYAFFTPPPSDSKVKRRKKLAWALKPTKKPDYDNIGKVVCDAINRIAYEDDCQITHATIVKRYGSKAFVQVYLSEDAEQCCDL